MSYRCLKILALLWTGSMLLQPLSMQQILPKSTQNCQNLPNSVQRQNFEIPLKIEILVFLKNKIKLICRESTRACFHLLDFQSKNFSYDIFIVKKRPLYVKFSTPACGNWWFSQSSTPCIDMRFCGYVPNSHRNKKPKRHISYLYEKVVFLTPKDCYPPYVGAKNLFLYLWMLWSCKW